MLSLCNILKVVFFQAEDGIRYLTVTGVQTCALPIWLDDPVELELLETQTAFLADEGEKWAAYVVGVGSGKTWAGAVWALTQIVNEPRTVGLIAANTYKQLSQSTLPPFLALLRSCGFVEGLHFVRNRAPTWYPSRFPRHEDIISFSHGPQVVTRSLENYATIRGLELGWAWLDETRDTRREAFQVVQARLRHPGMARHVGRITTTPNGYDWLYEFFVDPGKPVNRIVRARTADNSHLPDGYAEGLEHSYDPQLARQELEGEFIALGVGRVYPFFDRAKDVRRVDHDPARPLLLCCDFGVSPMAWVIAQEHEAFTAVLDEIVIDNATTVAAAQEFTRS